MIDGKGADRSDGSARLAFILYDYELFTMSTYLIMKLIVPPVRGHWHNTPYAYAIRHTPRGSRRPVHNTLTPYAIRHTPRVARRPAAHNTLTPYTIRNRSHRGCSTPQYAIRNAQPRSQQASRAQYAIRNTQRRSPATVQIRKRPQNTPSSNTQRKP